MKEIYESYILRSKTIEKIFGKEETIESIPEEKTLAVEENISSKELDVISLFEQIQNEKLMAGRPYYLDYEYANVLINDQWKEKVGGIPQGTFLLAFYEEEDEFIEALLLRVIKPVKIPSEEEVINAIIDYYKDNKETTGIKSEIDPLTKHELSYSAIKCRILGTYYKNNGEIVFGADVENFYSSYHYKTYKLQGKPLEYIVNSGNQFKIGVVRYSSSQRFQQQETKTPVYINPKDFLGKRTALFGMTRTGKSNTVKKIIEATSKISDNYRMVNNTSFNTEEEVDDFRNSKLPIGQIIFDIDGEYANKNRQDRGTAIFEMFDEKSVDKWSFIEKKGFKVMKTNFYEDILEGFSHIQQHFSADDRQFVNKFLSVDLSKPEDETDKSAMTRYKRRVAVYRCCLKKAGFEVPAKFETITFPGKKELNKLVEEDGQGKHNPTKGIAIDDAIKWFSSIWKNHFNKFFSEYEVKNNKPWADDGLKNLLIFLTKKDNPKRDDISDDDYWSSTNHGGYNILRPLTKYHTATTDKPYQNKIIMALREGKIVIVDLSEGDPEVQETYSEKICKKIFQDSMHRFGKNEDINFIQFYFEEAHNLFPKQDDKDLSQIYNRIAKEGAKLNLGIIYATQEVSSISSNILKNTQNWFIAHLNNKDELRELEKYYDFEDFIQNLPRFSPTQDKGFVRMKLYSNPFVVPVQIDEFKIGHNSNSYN